MFFCLVLFCFAFPVYNLAKTQNAIKNSGCLLRYLQRMISKLIVSIMLKSYISCFWKRLWLEVIFIHCCRTLRITEKQKKKKTLKFLYPRESCCFTPWWISCLLFLYENIFFLKCIIPLSMTEYCFMACLRCLGGIPVFIIWIVLQRILVWLNLCSFFLKCSLHLSHIFF